MILTDCTIVNIGCLSMNKFWRETERTRQASATCTLLNVNGQRIIVDPSPAPELLGPLLFASTGLKPADIDMVFVTHFHGDHWFGLDLFKGKPWYMAAAGLEEWRQNAPQDKEITRRFTAADGHVPDGVDLFASPGHTAGHYSLLVNTYAGRMIVAGDAVMTQDFYNTGDGFHNSLDFALVKDTIQRIRQSADLIVPGHGNYFVNPAGGRKQGR